jgi:hypothetical protein
MIAMKRKATALLFLLGITLCDVHADETEDLKNYYNSLLPSFQKLTPEASALGQYGTYSNSGYTGVPNISVPLFNLGSGDFSMPVGLSYDASGIKAEQQATYVGLGWNLMMGGSISQIVCGKNDFFEKSCHISSSPISNLDLLKTILPNVGYCPYYYMMATPSVSFPAISAGEGTCLPIESDRKKYDILQDVSHGIRIPDIFQASFCGHQVSFIIDSSSRKARVIGDDAAVYKIELKDYGASYPHGVEITDDHGLRYVFAIPKDGPGDGNVSYNLSEIMNAAGQSLVKFDYTSVSCTMLHPYYETMGKIRKPDGEVSIASEEINRTFLKRNYPANLIYSVKQCYLNTITTDKETVTFTYGSREDIKNAKRIDRITVTSNSDKGKILHTVEFNYGKFTESRFESELCSRYRYETVYGYNRLKLADVTVDGKKYSFGYNEDKDLPSRLTKQQDFWGYYNGQNNTEGFCASPECKFNDSGKLVSVETVGPANRYADGNRCKSGTLNKITYPTGGYTKFDYEINHFDDVNGKYYYPSAYSNIIDFSSTISCGSGFNGKGYNTKPDTQEFDVEELTKVEISSNTPYFSSSQNYYNLSLSVVGKDSSGKVVFSRYYTKYNDKEDFKETCDLPQGHYVLSSKFNYVASGMIIGGSIRVQFPPKYKEDSSIDDGSGKSIGGGLRIKTIENYDSDNSLLGYTSYKYEGGKLLIPTVDKEPIAFDYVYQSQSASGVNTTPETLTCYFFFVTSNPAYHAICSLGSSTVGYSTVTKKNYDGSGQLMSYDIEQYNNKGYENAYNNLFLANEDGLNGKLVKTVTYSKDNNPLHEVSNTYTAIGQNPSLDDMVFFPWARCLDMNPGRNYHYAYARHTPIYDPLLELFGIHSHKEETSGEFYVHYNYGLYSKSLKCVLPSRVTETTYADGQAMKPVVTTFEYKESNYQPSRITKTVDYGSNTKDISETRYWYPEDTEVSSSNVSCLTSAHCISEKVKAVAYRNGNTVGGYRNEYKALSNGLPVVSRNYSIIPSGDEILELDVTDHDSHGNICGYTKKDGTPVTIIWSYNHQLPVMEIVGMPYSVVKSLSSAAILENGTSAAEITSATESLHAALPNKDVLATAYEYSPWHTVSCIIKPNGDRTNYYYDSYGRLEKASDVDGKTIQKYEYNYRRQ